MSMQLSFWKKLGRNVLSLAMAVNLTVAATSGIVLPVDAASNYATFNFVNRFNNKVPILTTVAGTVTKIAAEVTSGYAMTSPPFSITQGNAPVTSGITAEYESGTASTSMYTIRINDSVVGGAQGQNKFTEFIMNGNLTTTKQASGQGTVVIPGAGGGKYGITVEADRPIGLTATTTLKTNVTSVNPALTSRMFSNAVTAGGFLQANYNGGAITESGASNNILKLTVQSTTTLSPIVFTVDLGSLKVEDLTQGTEIEFSFYRPETSPLNLQVYSVVDALDLISSGLESEKDSYVNEDGKTKVITLAKGDEMGSTGRGISQQFKLGDRVERLNTTFNLGWEWLPDDPLHQNVILIPQGGAGNVTINPELTDVLGNLKATVKFTPSVGNMTEKTDIAEIPIRIRGLGTPPAVTMNKKYTGDFNNTTNTPFDKEELLGNVAPTTLDVFNAFTGVSNYPLPTLPYKFSGIIDFGELRGAATKLVIKQEKLSNTDGELQLTLPDRKIENYKFGSDILNLSATQEKSIDNFVITAKKKGIVRISFDFYNSSGELLAASSKYNYRIEIIDTSPTDDSSLTKLIMGVDPGVAPPTDAFKGNYPGNIADFGFDPSKNDYYSLMSPMLLSNLVETISFIPTYNVQRNKNDITVKVTTDGVTDEDKVKSGVKTKEFALTVNQLSIITIDCVAENGDTRRYTIYVKRMPKSTDDLLKNLLVKPEEKSSAEAAYSFDNDVKFDPAFLGPYHVTVPYSANPVYVQAIANDSWAADVKFTMTPDLTPPITFMSRLSAIFQKQKTIPVYPIYQINPRNDTTRVEVTVTPEDGTGTRVYLLDIIRDAPSDDASIKELKLSYWLKTDRRTELPLALDMKFAPEYPDIITKRVEFSSDSVKLIITPNDYRAKKVTVSIEGTTISETLDCKKTGREPQPLTFKFDNLVFPANHTLVFKVSVLPESSELIPAPTPAPSVPYMIYIERQDPSRDLTADVTITNTLTNANINFGYSNIIDTYPVTDIDYTPGDMKVLVQVKPKDPKTTVKVQGNAPRPDGTLVPLTKGGTTTVTILLTAEDGSTRTITIPLRLKLPATAAYLEDLSAGGLPFLPTPTPFDKKKTTYKIEVPKGTAKLAITAKLLKDGTKDDSTNATITINGKAVKDGEAFSMQLSEKTGKIEVVVTAQDGKTKRTYTITYKNWNLIVPKEENILKSLTVDYGDLSPKFASNTQEYEVYVKPDARDLRVFPKLKDSNGAMRVVAGKVLAPFDGGYSVSLIEDKIDVLIYVWSEKDVAALAGTTPGETTPGGETVGAGSSIDMRLDKAKARLYTLHIYRDDEEKQGSLKPTEAADVDFDSTDPIVIDITQYPIIAADVFNRLKTEYPDKSILFKGNDYTLQCFGQDLTTIVPNAQSFDLRFSFTTPHEDKILDLGARDPVYFYFNQHGALPAEMLLTVDLGRAYRNQTLFWNYYNQERDRIDYYGYVNANATGTFSVPVSHFSTYMITGRRINGAENKSNEYANAEIANLDEENLNKPNTVKKNNVNTGVGG